MTKNQKIIYAIIYPETMEVAYNGQGGKKIYLTESRAFAELKRIKKSNPLNRVEVVKYHIDEEDYNYAKL